MRTTSFLSLLQTTTYLSLIAMAILASKANAQWIDELPQALRGSILWSADHEEGNLNDWTMPQGKDPGGGVLNTGDDSVLAQATKSFSHSGKYSAEASIHGAVKAKNGLRAVRFMRWANKPYDLGGAEFPSEAYYSTWMYLTETYNPNKYAPWDPGDGGWWNVFQFKAHDDQNESKPMWMLNVRHDDRTGRMSFYLYSPFHTRSISQQNVRSIPTGRWFHVEAYCKTGLKDDGRITVWQDGQKILEAQNVTTVLSSKNAHLVWGIGNYTDHIANKSSEGQATIYFDDAIVSTKPISPFVATARESK